MGYLEEILSNETLRNTLFPVTQKRTFLAHAAVTTLPKPATDALRWFADNSEQDHQEAGDIWPRTLGTRAVAAALLGAEEQEIALLGPTALGLNLVADGLAWNAGDEVVYYADDYPANVYPWLKLRALGVKTVSVTTEEPGVITWDHVECVLTSRTKLVSLASASFLSGYRVDLDGIGRRLRERDILFCVDGIQTLGAFPVSVEYIDFLSADSHKWLLGPLGAGIFYVKESNFSRLKPSLLGSWNVESPNYIAQDKIEFYAGARRYEPGSLNVPGILSMRASMELLQQVGMEAVAQRLLHLRAFLIQQMTNLGYTLYLPERQLDAEKSGIVTFCLGDEARASGLVHKLREAKITVSIRHNRHGAKLLRVSPHFYNTEAELGRLLDVLRY
ncbi:MAG: aminotransferase class V-fold PLP-dependent enzyme [Blastochloris sp.]|nr:aminotransferase class V-fold PLP-dependent enzyme [Blastochloris sp.]